MISIDIQELKRLYYDEQKSGFEIASTLPDVPASHLQPHEKTRTPAATVCRSAKTTVRKDRGRDKDIYQH